MNGYVDQVLKADAECADGAGPARGARSPLLFHGERGHQASNAFMVSNSHDQAIDVTFAIGELASGDGSVHFEPEARFTPSHCKVPPRGQQVVQCSLSLSADFAAGQAHHGHIQVVGYPEMAMPIRVEVEEAAAGANDPQPAKPKQKTSARKASAVKRKPAAKR
jgi:hypothetical protein